MTNTDHSRRRTLLVDNMGRRPVSQWLLFPSEGDWYRLHEGDPKGVARRHDGWGVSFHHEEDVVEATRSISHVNVMNLSHREWLALRSRLQDQGRRGWIPLT